MAYELKLDGVNDYAWLDTPYSLAVGDTLEFTGRYVESASSTDGQMFVCFYDNNNGFRDYASIVKASGLLTMRLNENTQTGSTVIADGDVFTFRLERDATSYRVYMQNTLQFTFNTTAQIDPFFGFNHNLTSVGSAWSYGGTVRTCTITNSAGTVHSLDANASGGTGLSIPDSISGNNATLVNSVTDDSQWLTYDSSANTPPVITLTSPATVTLNAGSTWDNSVITYTATDAEDGDLTSSVVLDDSDVDANTVDVYEVTLNVADSGGLPANEVTVTVNVVESTSYAVVVLAGQSNMVGRRTAEAVDLDYSGIGDTKQYGFNAQTIIDATNPLDQNGEQAGDTGLWKTMVEAFVENTTFDKPILLVPVAQGGTSFSGDNWNVGDPTYSSAVTRINAAMETHPDNELVAFMWHQGETDAQNNSTTHFANITAMYNGLLSETALTTDTPFIVGKIAAGGAESQVAAINADIVSFSSSLTNSAVVETQDQTLFDGLHFDAPSLRTIGTRYAEAYGSVKQATNELVLSVAGIPDGTYRTVLMLKDETISSGAQVYLDQNVTYDGGTASVSTTIAAGAEVVGFVYDNETPTVSGAFINVSSSVSA